MKKLLYLSIFIFAFCLLPNTTEAGILFKLVIHTCLVGYWDFQDGTGYTAHDKSGYDNDGTFQSAMTQDDWVDGKIGKALELDGGSNDYVDFGNPAELQLGNTGTVTAWLKYSTQGGPRGVVSKNNYVNDLNGYNLGISSSNQGITGEIADESDNNYIKSSGYDDDQWHHVVFTWDGSYLRIYVDGSSDATPVSQTLTPVSGVYNLHIGKIASVDNYYYDGIIDEVRIYNRALSAGEVERLYKLSQPKFLAPTREGLVGYWPFEEGTGTKAGDHSGTGNHGDLQNMEESDWKDGKLGGALDFNGSNEYVNAGNPPALQLGNTGTIAAWIFETDDNRNHIVGKNDWPNDRDGYTFEATNSGGSKRLIADLSSATANNQIWGDTSLQNDTWYHVVYTWDGSFLRLYLNGESDTTPVAQTLTPNSGVYDLWIGGSPTYGDAYFNGLIDEVRIYDRALEANEIEVLYKSGLAKINTSQNDKLTDGLVGLWSFNGPDMDGNEAYDRSGQGNHGTISGAVPTIGRIGQALDFDGDDDDIKILHDASLDLDSTDFTIVLWFITNIQPPPAFASLITKRDAYSTQDWRMYMSDTNGELVFFLGEGTGNWDAVLQGLDYIPPANEWHHIAMTRTVGSPDTYELFGNGVSKGTDTSTGSWTSSDSIFIGAEAACCRLNGKIDEVRIYNRALSEQEIQRLYNMGR